MLIELYRECIEVRRRRQNPKKNACCVCVCLNKVRFTTDYFCFHNTGLRLSSPYGYFAVWVWQLLLMILTSNFQEWKNVLRHDLKRKTWSRDPITTVVWEFENWKTDKKSCLFVQSHEVKPTKNVAIGKWERPTVGFNKLTTGRVANWQRAYQLPCWTPCAVWSWSNEEPHRE